MFDIFNRHAAAAAVCLALLTLAARLVAAFARVNRATHPRLAAASPDPVRVGAQTYEALTGRRLAPAWVLLGDALRGAAAAPSSPPADDPGARATVVPGDRPPGDEMTRAGRRGAPAGLLGATCLALVVSSLGCSGGAAGAAGAALKTATVVLEGAAEVRRAFCHRALDPLLGNPRPDEASADAPRSSGSQAPAPPPAPSSPPALPPPTAATPAIDGDASAPDDAAAPATDGR